MSEQPSRALGLAFGTVAEQYERHRLGYPPELVDEVLEHHGRPVRTALEVGAGTGKATRLFAARGVHVTALEPDPDMARVLAATTAGLPVVTVSATFEEHAGRGRHDLLYAAAAWHWTDPATRWERAVALLAPGGVLALFGAPCEPADPAVQAAVDAVEQEVLRTPGLTGVPWSLDQLAAVDGLADPVERLLPRTVPTTAAGFLGRLGTVSAYLELGPAARADALRRVDAVLPRRFDLDATVRLSLARRV